MTEQEQIEQLKAQVIYLRDELRATHDFLWKAGIADYIARDIEKALAKTPEQCLAEVKAKAIGDMQLKLTPHTIDGNAYYRAGDVAMHTSQLRGQISVSEQLDLATKIMTVTI